MYIQTRKQEYPNVGIQDILAGRGTIQGDTLSPFLLLVFFEPLVRWLQHKGCGSPLAAGEKHVLPRPLRTCICRSAESSHNLSELFKASKLQALQSSRHRRLNALQAGPAWKEWMQRGLQLLQLQS